MSLPESEAWFGPKKYGYGWGLPLRWQGWAVYGVYLAAMVVPTFFLTSRTRVTAYFVYVFLLTMGALAICMWKGVKPRWRWNDPPSKER